MSTSLGEAVLDLIADDSSLLKGIEGAKGKALDALGGLSNVGGMIFKTGLLAATAGAAILTKGLYESVQAAMEAETVQAQLNAVLESTGGVAGVSADQVNEYADSLSQMTMFDDEAIVSAESMLLTFTNIGKDVFPDATKTVLDMSQALGQDLQSSSIQLGKALNDPINGVTALQRVGVKFTDAQKDTIKALVNSGKLEEAQAMILKELQTEFGGSAEAAGKTFPGQLKILQTKLGNIQENIGAKLLPVLGDLATMFTDYLNRPETQAFLANLADTIAKFGRTAIDNIPYVIQTFKDMFTWLQDNKGVIVGMLAVIGTALAAFAYTTLAPLLPIIAIMALIGGAAYLLYEAWTNNWGGIQEKVAAAWAVIQPLLQQLWTWLQINVPLALQALATYWSTTLLPALQNFWMWVTTNLIPFFISLWTWLSTNIPAALQTLATFWTGTLLPPIQAVWGWMSSVLFPFWLSLANFLGAVFSVAVTVLAGIWQNVLRPALEAVVAVISAKLMPGVTKMSGFFSTTLLPVIKTVAKFIKETLVKAFSTLSGIIQTITDTLGIMTDGLNNIDLPDWMTPGSPTPWEIGLRGVGDALKTLNTLSLPSLTSNLNLMPAPASVGGGNSDIMMVNPTFQVNDRKGFDELMRTLRTS